MPEPDSEVVEKLRNLRHMDSQRVGETKQIVPRAVGIGIAKQIDDAQDSIDVAMYSISTSNKSPIFAALTRALRGARPSGPRVGAGGPERATIGGLGGRPSV